MLEFLSNPIVAGGLSILAAALLTFAVRAAASKYGFVAKPKSDRWHKRPTAMMGGAAIFLTTILAYALLIPKTREFTVVVAASTLLFIVGLLDDLVNIKPYQKLVG